MIEARAGERATTRRASSPLRISFFSYGLPVVGEKRGGVDRVAHDLAHGLGRRGHQVTVWSYDAKPELAAYEVRPLPWRRFVQSWAGYRMTLGYLGNLLALAVARAPADVVVAMGDSLLLPVMGRPVVRVMSGSALGEALSARSPLRSVLQAGVYAQELLTALTQPGCVAISGNTRSFNPFVRRVIPIGTDLTRFAADAAAKSPDPSILFVGTLEGRKRGGLLLEWYRESVRARFPTATLRMVSARGPTVAGVTYLTGISQAELAAEYRRAWVYASPSSYEGFGLPYVEAMASGTPVIASPNPGSREVLAGGRYGRIVEDGEFAAALCELLENAEARARLTAAGLQRAKEYDIESTIDEYEKLLLSLIGRG